MTEIPADLRAAFDAYEAAILANDLDALDAAFAPGADTMRGDGAGPVSYTHLTLPTIYSV